MLNLISNLIENRLLAVVALLSSCISIPVYSLQANTPQGALEEIATADKPEILVRHLPEPIQKSIEALPKPKKLEVLSQLMRMKAEQFDNCTVRRTSGDTWEIVDQDGKSQGTVKLENAFISGLDALLPMRINSETVIVTLHLEGNEWRIQDFGNWQKSDMGISKLLHEPTEIEKNEEAARNALSAISSALQTYSRWHPQIGFPSTLRPLLTKAQGMPFFVRPLLDESYSAEPLVVSGYEFHYLLTFPGDGQDDAGRFELRASPVEFGKTGVKSFLMTSSGGLHVTSENRPATDDDSRVSNGDNVVIVD
jgi:type II secretory pathway pseudopilin PulG